ncbi:hypothetical protein ALC56_14540, partial [Trachymyrmex septentrionalis]
EDIILWNNEAIELYQTKMKNCNLVKYNVKERFKELSKICKETFCKKNLKICNKKVGDYKRKVELKIHKIKNKTNAWKVINKYRRRKRRY